MVRRCNRHHRHCCYTKQRCRYGDGYRFCECWYYVARTSRNNYLRVQYAVRLSDNQLNRFDHQYLASTIRTVSDLERIGDYATNIVEYAESLLQQEVRFSDYAINEIEQMEQLISSLFESTMQAYHSSGSC